MPEGEVRDEDQPYPTGGGRVQYKFRVVTRSELKLRLILHLCFVH